jgi:hypothetical protein
MDSNETMSRLKFIGKIQPGEKINTKFMYIQPNTIFTRLSRSLFFQDNRTKTLVFLQDTINKAFEILKCYDNSKKNSEKMMCINVISDLKVVRTGLKNLKETYIALNGDVIATFPVTMRTTPTVTSSVGTANDPFPACFRLNNAGTSSTTITASAEL